MTDSADMKAAAESLDAALRSLEDQLGGFLNQITSLKGAIKDAERFGEDRVRLAAQLDETTANLQAREREFAEREAAFKAVASATTQELDHASSQGRDAIKNKGVAHG